jgi:hypothetical protein
MPMTDAKAMGCRPGTLREVLQRATPDRPVMLFQALQPHLAECLDEFYLDTKKRRQYQRVQNEPNVTGDRYADTYLAAVAEHLCCRWRFSDPPAWVERPERFMKTLTFLGPPRERAFMLAESPLAFRRRLIFTEAEPLSRARMPHDARFLGYEALRSGLEPAG